MISYLLKLVALTAFLVVLISYATDHSKATDAGNVPASGVHDLS